MVDVDTFLTTPYVMVDDFCHSLPPARRPGPETALSDSEVIALAIFARWGRFSSERPFYRYAQNHLRGAFPTLPDRSQFNRQVRSYVGLIKEVALHLAPMPSIRGAAASEALNASAMPVRDAKRRGEGWLAGYADIGWSNSLGWYKGFCLLVSVDPTGDHRLRLRLRFHQGPAAGRNLLRPALSTNPGLRSVGSAASGPYVVDKGFEDEDNHRRRWLDRYGARVVCPPKNATGARGVGPSGCGAGQRASARSWKPSTRSFTMPSAFREQPREMRGLRARLAARVALHNFCIWLNERLGRHRLAFADLLGW